uniref:hypothetical protein n=1 Tax=Cereibacter sediminicola TaxID=2584941 RepID=UPI001C92D5AF
GACLPEPLQPESPMAKGMSIRGNRQTKKPKQPKKAPAVVAVTRTHSALAPSSGSGTLKKP